MQEAAQLTKRVIYLSLILSIYAFSLTIQSLLFLNWDVASLLYATKLLLAGGSYVNDIFTPNPPMILYLYTLPIIFSQLFNLNIVNVFSVYVYGLCTISIVMCYILIKGYFSNQDRHLLGIFMVILTISYMVLPIYEFGNRDHLLLILSMPYLLTVVSRLKGNKVDPRFAIIIGLFAGIGFAIKPQFLITLALIELYTMFFQRNILAWIRIETLVISAVLVTYAATTFLFHANFIYIIVPFLMRNYYSAIGMSLSLISWYPPTLFCFMTVAFYLFVQQSKKNILFNILLIALIGFLFSIYLQRTLFYYHFIPALSIALLLSVMMLYLFVNSANTIDMIKATTLALTFIIIDVYNYYYTWSYILLNPWYFYSFFFLLYFLLLLNNNSKLSILSAFIRVSFIVMIGVLGSSILIKTGYFTHRFLIVLLLMAVLYVLFAMRLDRNLCRHALIVSLVLSIYYVPVMYEYSVYLGAKQYKRRLTQ